MDPVLQITYTPEYFGCHRIYLRVELKTQYSPQCVYIDNSPSIINQPKIIEISLLDLADCFTAEFADNMNRCNTFNVEFSIIPCCTDETPEFYDHVVKFAPNPCQTFTIECGAADCNSFNYTDCAGNIIASARVDNLQTINICSLDNPSINPDGNANPVINNAAEDLCCQCKQFNVANLTNFDLNVYFYNCDTLALNTITVAKFPITETFCAASTPWSENVEDSTVTEIGNCPE